MKNIWNIFRSDWKRLTASVVAVVVLLGMCVLFTVLGLLLYYPARRLNAAIAASKERSGIM